MAKFIVPHDLKDRKIAPSLSSIPDDGSTSSNPSVLPAGVLSRFQYVFLIRNPHEAIPSCYRMTSPEQSNGLHKENFFESIFAGYLELRLLFEYVLEMNMIRIDNNGVDDKDRVGICLIDADDMLADPSGMLQKFCGSVGVEFKPDMLKWEANKDCDVLDIWVSTWHADAIASTGFERRERVSLSMYIYIHSDHEYVLCSCEYP